MKLTKGIISREKAVELVPVYVAFIEKKSYDRFDAIYEVFNNLKRGQQVITYHDGQFVKAKVSSVSSNTPLAVDGPVVRVSNGEFSWRVDGDSYAAPI